MKAKLLLFLLFIAASPLIFGQTLLYEDFSSGTNPPTGWTVDSHSANWQISMSGASGSIPPEGMLNWTPQFNGTSRLISPVVNTSGYTQLIISYNQMVDNYSGGYKIGVATRAGTSGTWNSVYEKTVTASFGPEYRIILVENANVGASDFQLCLYFTGSSYNLNYWYFDDIRLAVSHNRNAALTKLNVPKYSLGNSEVQGAFYNMGQTPVTSIDISWQADGETVHVTPYSGLNLDFGESYAFTANDPLFLTPGNHLLKAWVGNVNGDGPDEDQSDDTLAMNLVVASDSANRRPFFEEFTSSTCAPCATFNGNIFNAFTTQHEDEITLVKYQMDWPGVGDPYYTEEGGVRRYFYNVSYVPDLYTDGMQTATTSNGVNTAFNNSMDNAAFMTINAYHSFSNLDADTTVEVLIDISSYITATLNVYAALLEEVTYDNIMTNGETEFHHVMMKMVPDAYGTTVNLVDGEIISIDVSASLSNTNIERMSDLIVAVWVQDTASKIVFQTAYSDSIGVGIPPSGSPETIRVYPNPTTGKVFIKGINEPEILKVFDNMGKQVIEKTNITSGSLDLGDLPVGLYILQIRSKEGVRTARVNIIR